MMDQGVEQVKNLFGRVKTLPYGGGLWGDCKGYQVCVILNVVKNLRMEWVLSIDGSGKILRLCYATLRMTLDWELVKTMHYAFSILRYIFGLGEKSPVE